MLDVMHDCFFWLQMAIQAKEHVGKCCQCITYNVKQQRAAMKSIVGAHPLEVVYIDYI